MPITIPNDVASSIAQGTTHIARLWKIERTDGIEMHFSDHSSAVLFQGDTYTPVDAIVGTATRKGSGLRGDDAEVSGAISSDEITEIDLRTGRYSGAKVSEYKVNASAPWLSAVSQRVYWISTVSRTSERWEAVTEGVASWLRTNIGDRAQLTCRADLGDSKCGVNLTPWTITPVTVNISSSRKDFDAVDVWIGSTLNGESVVDNFFVDGEILWLTGDNAGIAQQVKAYTHVDRVFELTLEAPNDIANGDTFTLTIGCDKILLSDCVNVFSNAVNFRGEPWLPTTDEALKHPPV